MTRFLAIVILAAGCGTTESGNLLTAGMSASMEVQADGTNTTVTAELFSGNPDQLIFVKLTDGDQLNAFRGPDEEPMIETQLATIVAYSAVYSGSDDSQPFTIALDRTVDAGAPASMATLPTPFDIQGLQPTQSRAQALTVSWTSVAADPMHFKIEGSCIQTFESDLPANSGTLTVTANSIMKMQGTNIPDTCMATLTVTRTRPGSLDPAFGKGGNIIADQLRAQQFTTTL